MEKTPDQNTPHIWLPTTTTKVTVIEGKVTVWDEIEMEQRPITKNTGFTKKVGSEEESQLGGP